jgi:Protein of unknown function (DUF3277)
MKTYDPKLVVITFGGVPLSGFADGTFIKVSRSADLFTKSVGADGVFVRSKSNDKSGEVSVTLQQTSMSNSILAGFAAQDEASNTGVKPLIVTDASGTSKFFSALAYIRKPADSTFAKTVENRDWIFDCDQILMAEGGSADVVPVA